MLAVVRLLKIAQIKSCVPLPGLPPAAMYDADGMLGRGVSR